MCNSIGSLKTNLPGILVTRKWLPQSQCFIVLRRVGRNATKQFYSVNGPLPNGCCFVDNGKIKQSQTWIEKKHAVHTEYFLKIYFETEKTQEDLIELCLLMWKNPEQGYDRKQPHAITTKYVYEMIRQWLHEK